MAKRITEIGQLSDLSGEALIRMWQVNVPKQKRIFQNHKHIQFEISVIVGGKGTYVVNERAYDMEKGDVFVFSSNEAHCITEAKEELEFINIHINPKYLWGSYTDSLSEEHINICFGHSKDFENRIPAEKASELRDIFKKLSSEFKCNLPEYRLMIKSVVNLLLISLIRSYDYAESSSYISRNQIKSIRKAVSFIDANFAEKITLEEISEIAGISPTYFSALFKKVSNVTLWQYVESKRIDKAIRLICDDKCEDSMLDIALQCGFNNTANFNKCFKKQTGVTPSQYKNSPGAMMHGM